MREPLQVLLRNAVRTADGAGFEVDFVLVNAGRAPVFVYERWNSWGAYQWRFFIEDAHGRHISATNPQQDWTKNFPSALAVAPGAEHVLPCVVLPAQPHDWRPGTQYFVADAPFAFPLRVQGVFESHPEAGVAVDAVGVRGLERPVSLFELWSGSLASGSVALP